MSTISARPGQLEPYGKHFPDGGILASPSPPLPRARLGPTAVLMRTCRSRARARARASKPTPPPFCAGHIHPVPSQAQAQGQAQTRISHPASRLHVNAALFCPSRASLRSRSCARSSLYSLVRLCCRSSRGSRPPRVGSSRIEGNGAFPSAGWDNEWAGWWRGAERMRGAEVQGAVADGTCAPGEWSAGGARASRRDAPRGMSTVMCQMRARKMDSVHVPRTCLAKGRAEREGLTSAPRMDLGLVSRAALSSWIWQEECDSGRGPIWLGVRAESGAGVVLLLSATEYECGMQGTVGVAVPMGAYRAGRFAGRAWVSAADERGPGTDCFFHLHNRKCILADICMTSPLKNVSGWVVSTIFRRRGILDHNCIPNAIQPLSVDEIIQLPKWKSLGRLGKVVKLLPSGRYVLFQHWITLECWDVSGDKLIWRHASTIEHAEVQEFAAEEHIELAMATIIASKLRLALIPQHIILMVRSRDGHSQIHIIFNNTLNLHLTATDNFDGPAVLVEDIPKLSIFQDTVNLQSVFDIAGREDGLCSYRLSIPTIGKPRLRVLNRWQVSAGSAREEVRRPPNFSYCGQSLRDKAQWFVCSSNASVDVARVNIVGRINHVGLASYSGALTYMILSQPANATTAASWRLNSVGRTLAMAFATALHRRLPFSLFSLLLGVGSNEAAIFSPAAQNIVEGMDSERAPKESNETKTMIQIIYVLQWLLYTEPVPLQS
ncbi:hypothetical protein C8R45DRAFT_1131247 [Mycena sanguinolenta]|nr:hypothetical protein C8R45DRAFT_1131247 [Mycena sanguinolenta]